MKITKKKLADFTGGDFIRFMMLLGFLKGLDKGVQHALSPLIRTINQSFKKSTMQEVDEELATTAAIRVLIEQRPDHIYVIPDGTRLFTLDDEDYVVYTDAPRDKNFNDLSRIELHNLVNSRRKRARR